MTTTTTTTAPTTAITTITTTTTVTSTAGPATGNRLLAQRHPPPPLNLSYSALAATLLPDPLPRPFPPRRPRSHNVHPSLSVPAEPAAPEPAPKAAHIPGGVVTLCTHIWTAHEESETIVARVRLPAADFVNPKSRPPGLVRTLHMELAETLSAVGFELQRWEGEVQTANRKERARKWNEERGIPHPAEHTATFPLSPLSPSTIPPLRTPRPAPRPVALSTPRSRDKLLAKLHTLRQMASWLDDLCIRLRMYDTTMCAPTYSYKTYGPRGEAQVHAPDDSDSDDEREKERAADTERKACYRAAFLYLLRERVYTFRQTFPESVFYQTRLNDSVEGLVKCVEALCAPFETQLDGVRLEYT
ncbi:uncharacterized protein LOC62_01G000147 [Vanrija pseudolonga]|uniref:Uncharacterized protein n=1 Tax=Vanrija pseudolonga TaxID=143232 RepID=A0AAF0Y2N1_9TREE|nr:hypothetical protein LOC62_01G000147 [Vanrija pseudolonga]